LDFLREFVKTEVFKGGGPLEEASLYLIFIGLTQVVSVSQLLEAESMQKPGKSNGYIAYRFNGVSNHKHSPLQHIFLKFDGEIDRNFVCGVCWSFWHAPIVCVTCEKEVCNMKCMERHTCAPDMDSSAGSASASGSGKNARKNAKNRKRAKTKKAENREEG
jgi:hypothetical protein